MNILLHLLHSAHIKKNNSSQRKADQEIFQGKSLAAKAGDWSSLFDLRITKTGYLNLITDKFINYFQVKMFL